MPRSQTSGGRAGCERPRGPRTRAQAPQAASAPRPAGRRAPRAAPAGPGAVGLARHGALARHQVAHQRRGRGRLHGAVGQRRAGQAQARGVDQRPVERGRQRGRRADRHGDRHHHALRRTHARSRAAFGRCVLGRAGPDRAQAPAGDRPAAAPAAGDALQARTAAAHAVSRGAPPQRALGLGQARAGGLGRQAPAHASARAATAMHAAAARARHARQGPTAGRMCGMRAGAAGLLLRSRPGTLPVTTRAQRRAAAPG